MPIYRSLLDNLARLFLSFVCLYFECCAKKQEIIYKELCVLYCWYQDMSKVKADKQSPKENTKAENSDNESIVSTDHSQKHLQNLILGNISTPLG